MDALVSQPVSDCRPDIQEPVEGAIEQHINQNPTPNEAGSSLGSLTQVIEQLSHPEPPPNVAESSLGCVTQEPGSCTQVRHKSIISCEHYIYDCSDLCVVIPV